jgi:fatty acid amide hydrolase 2
MSVLERSATSLAAGIRGGELSSRDVVEAHIAQVQAVNPTIRAMVADRFDAARAEADAADQAVRDGLPLPPFHGVPCTIKEAFAVRGMPWTGGLTARVGTRAPRDAVTVARLRDAGGIVLGVTNLSELCMWFESDNPVYGRTVNPYDADRIAGGSSGGEGAIVGAGASPFGLGADVGGSIRMPAFFCGVFGHKPGSGVVPNSGQFPLTSWEASPFLASGPLARRAEDLMPLLRTLAGPDGTDPVCTPTALGDPAEVAFTHRPVLTVGDGLPFRVEAVLSDAVGAAATELVSAGGRAASVDLPALRKSFDLWSSAMSAAEGPGRFLRLMRYRRRRQLLRHAHEHTLPAVVLGLVEDVGALSQRRVQRHLEILDQLRDDLVLAMGDGVLVYPSHTRRAPRHRSPWRRPFDWVYTGIFNVLGFPVTQVPMGLADGLPTGVQVVAAPGNDHVAIAAAMRLEQRFGGWVPPG